MHRPTPVRTRWAVDPSHSSVTFAVKHLLVARATSCFGRFAGAIELDDADPARLPLELTIDAALHGRGQTRTFWVLAALSAAIEPAYQGIPLSILANSAISPAAFAAYLVHSYALNFAAAVSLRRYGLLAPVLVCPSNYLVWHVLYANFSLG